MTTISLIGTFRQAIIAQITNKVIIKMRFFILFLILCCSYSFAETNYRKKIENFARSLISAKYNALPPANRNEKLQINLAPLDKRLTFAPCISSLSGVIVGNKLKKNTSVKVTCSDPKPWSTYVRSRVLILSPSIVTSQPLSKGQMLNSDNIKLTYIDKSHIRIGSFSEAYTLFGTRLKRNLTANKIITNRDICFVCKDDKVTILAIKSGLSIKASGIALSDAIIGGTVRARNSRTQRIIVGTVSAPKEIQVAF